MLDEKEKTSKFLEAIQKAAMEKCTSLEEEFRHQLQEELKRTEEEASRRCHALIDGETEKIKAGTRRALAKHEAAKRQEISHKRIALQETIFQNVRAELENYSKTPAYASFLLNNAKEIAGHLKEDDAVIYLRKQDLSHAGELQALFSGKTSVEEDKENTLGGIRVAVPARKIMFNNTLDAKLTQETDWFMEHADLKIM